MQPKEILEGSPLSTLFYLSLPAILSGWIQTTFELIDAYWVSHLADASMSVLSASTFIIWNFFCFPMLLHPGLNQQISFKLGQGKTNEAQKLAFNGIIWSFQLGILLGLVGYFLLPYLLEMMHLTGDLKRRTSNFIQIFFCNLPFAYSFLGCLAIIRGHGHTKKVAILTTTALLINGILDPIFIYSLNFGVYGAAIASLIAMFSGLVLALIVIHRSQMSTIAFPPKGSLKTLLKIGYPFTANNLIFCIVYLFLTRYIVSFGEAPLAAVGITVRLEGIAFFCAIGIGTASTTAIGLHLGKGNIREAIQCGNSALLLATFFVVPWSLLLIFAPTTLMSLFTQNPEEIKHGAELLRIVGYFEVALGIECTLEGVFAGLGKTFLAGSLAFFFTLMRVPMVLFFIHVCKFGVVGIWWAISLSTLFKGVALGFLWYLHQKALRKEL